MLPVKAAEFGVDATNDDEHDVNGTKSLIIVCGDDEDSTIAFSVEPTEVV